MHGGPRRPWERQHEEVGVAGLGDAHVAIERGEPLGGGLTGQVQLRVEQRERSATQKRLDTPNAEQPVSFRIVVA